MSKTKLPDNPFATNGNSTALASRETGGLTQRNGNALPSRQAGSMSLNPFSSEAALPQTERSPIPLGDTFAPRKGTLPCRNDRLAASPFADIDLQIFCCGVQLEMDVADMTADGPDAIPGGQISVVDRVLHGTCSKCGHEHHHSVGAVVAHDQYR